MTGVSILFLLDLIARLRQPAFHLLGSGCCANY